MNIYQILTQEFNHSRLRAILSSGQACVLHKVVMMSKDGDWILKEDEECVNHILSVLEQHGAKYRPGAPLDTRWLNKGWSSHFEFYREGLRIRCDFMTRPPRIGREDIEKLWTKSEGMEIPFVGLSLLIETKKTSREQDYPIIGELARRIPDVEGQLYYSRSARDIMAMAEEYPEIYRNIITIRPILKTVPEGRETLERALDEERRQMMKADEVRVQAYLEASIPWRNRWLEVERKITGLPLKEAHKKVTEDAEKILPMEVLNEEQNKGSVLKRRKS